MRKLLVFTLLSLCACQTHKTCEVTEPPVFDMPDVKVSKRADPFWWTYYNRNEKRDKIVIYHPEEDYIAP